MWHILEAIAKGGKLDNGTQQELDQRRGIFIRVHSNDSSCNSYAILAESPGLSISWSPGVHR
jgi:hypothetical protein